MRSEHARRALKAWLGRVPGLAEVDWHLRRTRPPLRRHLRAVAPYLTEWGPWAAARARQAPSGRKVALFAMLSSWVAQTAVLGLALAAQGHEVTLGYLPYQTWWQPDNPWDWRKWSLHLRELLHPAAEALNVTPLLNEPPDPVPPHWEAFLAQLSAYDVEYTRQREGADEKSPLYRLRLARNRAAAGMLAHWLRRTQPDVLIVPNGAILEFGVAYEVAHRLGIPTVTYEFEYQREHAWISQGLPVMELDTTDLWQAVSQKPLAPQQLARLQEMMTARRGGRTWETHARAWQNVGRAGQQVVRQRLGLDERPLILIATNVFGDSVTIGRQVFTRGMGDWLAETLRFFARHPQVQVVVRVHPGESQLAPGGTSMLDVVSQTFPNLPENIKVVPPDADINSYDLVEMAQVGLVYTTTLGLEMAMDGLPVIVAGRVHYRGRGFTYDPPSWEAYFRLLEQAVAAPESLRPQPDSVALARRYAYHFFFTYPRPYPWHIAFWEESLQRWPLPRALEEPRFTETLAAFTGAPLRWEDDRAGG